MPFTFSHPAIVIPLKKLSPHTFSLTGLVIGSIVPDFEYFTRMSVKSVYSHSIFGLFWFDLPLGLMLTFVYHDVVRDLFTVNLPAFLSARLSDCLDFKWNAYFRKKWLIVIISIFIGAVSHLFWDSFTHPHGYFVHRLASLRKGVNILSIHITLYQVLQQWSSIVGGIVVIWAIFQLKIKSVPQPKNQVNYWLIVSGITLTTLGCRFFTRVNLHLYGDVVVTGITGFLLGIVITPLIFKFSSGKITSGERI